ncbi:hypothetical protein SAMN03159341_13238 [Paenibacillus sp. 1_12]|uniref:hypothetical protein n=1 Tax=Paenibacillus sp. 1_12 TaxID=1566278 RepID=UPI0008E58ECF|nr:hypothetical protein [Paenibacillus sp. 1_12]SFM42486.1 hypothetical protein SAMN03159341_13238 [Paenibacillus sp. 1_12]
MSTVNISDSGNRERRTKWTNIMFLTSAISFAIWLGLWSSSLMIVEVPLSYEIGDVRWQSGSSTIEVGTTTMSWNEFDLLQKKARRENPEVSQFSVKVGSTATFIEGRKKLHVVIGNLESNKNDFYFELLHMGEVVYTSTMLKPNQSINSVKLDKPLPDNISGLVVKYYLIERKDVIDH